MDFLRSEGSTLICPANDRDVFRAGINCTTTCPSSSALRWNITVPRGLVPTCEYRIDDADEWVIVPSTLTGPTPRAEFDEYSCEPTSTIVRRTVSSNLLFELAVGLNASGVVWVERWRL
jgi:hypothetical protein